jgi:hypothetical protein
MTTSNPVTLGPWKGMNNRLDSRSLPPDLFRNAVNVIFNDAGMVQFPGFGKTQVYSGTKIHSLYRSGDTTLFVENGVLKRLNSDYTATVLRSGMGHTKCFYASVGNLTYFCNQVVTGKYDALTGICSEWGTPTPPRQPDLSVSSTGCLYGGTYRIALTWIADGSESGTGLSKRITVPAGGGINLSNFPVPPSYVTHVCVYVSDVNGKDKFWQGDYPANTSYVHVGYSVLTIPLTTQFASPPRPKSILAEFNGRIYYKDGNKVYYTSTRNYGLQKANQYWTFDGEVKNIQALPPVLYIHTDNALFSVTGIDAEGSPPQLNRIKNYGATEGTSISSTDDELCYGFTDRGFVQYNANGSVVELNWKDVATPSFKNGCATLLEQDGSRYLLFAGTGGQQNPLADSAYNASELIRGSL